MTENETIADIVREMRDLSDALYDKQKEGADILDVWSIVSKFADRIEAAAARSDDSCALHGGVTITGAVAGLKHERDALRAALRECMRAMDGGMEWNADYRDVYRRAAEVLDAALRGESEVKQ